MERRCVALSFKLLCGKVRTRLRIIAGERMCSGTRTRANRNQAGCHGV
ncbi:MAG: hypothetical protein ICV68_02345 [Pyrinomonadaceae bacterium]|nr:hypothetical protein [Pyrinomonadaceae bacterium]